LREIVTNTSGKIQNLDNFNANGNFWTNSNILNFSFIN